VSRKLVEKIMTLESNDAGSIWILQFVTDVIDRTIWFLRCPLKAERSIEEESRPDSLSDE
jgi:hypothetical protein